MIKKNLQIQDLDVRLARDEWYYLSEKYQNVAFNARWGSRMMLPPKYRHLLVAEPHIEIPENWDLNIISKYQSYITYSSKMANVVRAQLPSVQVHLIRGVPACNSYFCLDEFVEFNKKINGIICLNKINYTGREGDIYFMRERVMQSLDLPVKHVFSRTPWGGSMYAGSIPYYHSHYENLKKINEYKFCLCFESTYHPFHSYDFITERIFNCFKSKTIAVYYGCFNIEDYVPKNLFIDYRDFDGDSTALSKRLMEMSESEYEDIVDSAYKWQETNNIGSIRDLEEILSSLD
jgi:hypothetical protein